MSKKNRYKFRNREANRQAVAATNNTSVGAAASAPSHVRNSGGNASGAFAQHAAEYRVINADLIRLIVLNGIMLAAVIALYYANRSSGIVEKMYHSLVS